MLAALGAALTVFVGGVAALLVVRWAGVAGGAALAAAPDALSRSPDGGVAAPASRSIPAPERVPVLGGCPPAAHAWSRYHVRYYAMALLFLAFDMEMVFMYPWAVVFVGEGMKALVEMLMFIAILVLGILYAWREGALRWS